MIFNMRIILKISVFTFAMMVCCHTAQTVQILPPAGGFRSAQDRDNFMFYQNYNYQNEQQELLRRQIQIQQEMLNLQRQQQHQNSW